MTTQPTRLGQVIANQAAAAATAAKPVTPLGLLLAKGRPGEDVDIAGIGLVRIELIGVSVGIDIESAVQKTMRRLELEPGILNAANFEADRAVRLLAHVVVDPKTREPIGTLEEWQQIDETIILACIRAHADIRENHDPHSPANILSDQERIAIATAHARRDAATLRTFGSAKIAHYMATSDPPIAPKDPPS